MVRSRLEQERLSRGMSYRDVAKAIGLTERALRYIVSGEKNPSWETACKLEDLFGISARELLVPDSTPDSETA
ncbi:MAG: helix-turn-helix transcriptional regulator [Firmicutes bacterium]|nr:helix-turn-helix transcriptional regulator [Bacillota bacterium]